MISQVNQAGVRTAYANSLGEGKEVSKKASATVSQQGDTSKVERIKEALESGEYKINLQALSEKIAEELM
ncbi:flagellar biosynthesis anti-sigma factor FlgM [Sulfurimonas sp.]|jgi:anti-sigma28 factor (negative regulator of flagellin synthesis)|uniref:flagellar biosynthesis anti-sigma factor FlgM n=1 Tax=Sulfurimonas sp. TaxID=2022749 RepID=UPI002A35BC56|nr:flagellar biosynthesis anti-sigma factor FlgM [Sulfurimonas sp.]MDY0123646.1 flagellar biosynthesis anti-sigma factor FlgM [Sulfurimonas sp.]